MTYYEVENEEVVKYEVILNREELEKIKQKIHINSFDNVDKS